MNRARRAAIALSLVLAPCLVLPAHVPPALAGDPPAAAAAPKVVDVADAAAARALDPAVTHVRLGAGADDAALAGLAHLKGLASVVAADSAVTDAGLRAFPAAPALRELDLSRCAGVTAAGLKAVGALKKLEVVRLAGLTSIDDAALVPLGKLPRLRVADLSGCTKLGDGAIKALREVETLKELDLSGVRLSLPGTTQLARLQGLEVLRLARTAIPDEAMLNIVVLRNLEVVDVSGNPDFGWIGLLHLGGLRKLREFRASGLPNLSDEALQRASKMETLEIVDISNCPRLSEAGIAALAASPRLKSLDISRTHATGKALAALVKSKSLRRIRIENCPDLKADDIAAARAAAPSVTIETE